jgi:radical SAM superfamily enzyme YgiQ (UPF0313 family)
MKIDIVHPAHYRNDGSLVQAKKLVDRLGAYMPHLGPALLAALTPSHHQVRYVEEYIEDIDFNTDADVVAISAQIMQFKRSVDIAREFKRRGKTTVLGGFLPSLIPERVEGLFDAIVVGEGDESWPRLLDDIEHGCIKPRYDSTGPADISDLPIPRYDIFKRDRLVIYPVQATRGCPFTCSYCSIASVYNGSFRHRPVEHILRDIEATGSRNIYFCDDNLCEDVKFADRLFSAMAGCRHRWGTQTSINVSLHPALLSKARRAGCLSLALGIETLSVRNLEDVNKTFHAIDRYADGMRRIMDAGISPHALIIFGLPDDRPDTFKRTLDYLENLKIPVAQFFILTPYPGTPTGNKIWEENKVFDKDISHLREPYVVFQPDNLTPEQLHSGWWRTVKQFYSLRSIIKRVVASPNRNFLPDMAINFYYWLKVKRGIHTVYFGEG